MAKVSQVAVYVAQKLHGGAALPVLKGFGRTNPKLKTKGLRAVRYIKRSEGQEQELVLVVQNQAKESKWTTLAKEGHQVTKVYYNKALYGVVVDQEFRKE